MATKTTGKTAAKKPVAKKPAGGHKPGTASPSRGEPAASKGKVVAPAKKKEPEHKPAAAVTPKPAAKPAPREMKTVSLIDKQPSKKAEGDAKKKAAALPPISRIRASLEAPVVAAAKPAAPAPAPAAPDVAAATEAAEPEEAKNVIH